MKELTLRTYPDPCLRIKTAKVENFDPELAKILKNMTDIMYINQGCGLAATQVGLGLDVFVMDTGDGPLSFVNAEIVELSSNLTVMEEGCLSLPGITVKVSRPDTAKVSFQDKDGNRSIREFKGLSAKAVQHEMDHLKGVLLVDHLSPVRRFMAKRSLISRKKNNKERACEVTCDIRTSDK